MQQMQNEEIEGTVKKADELWAAYRAAQDDPQWAKKEVTDKISYFQGRGFGDFITKYAIPTRYMVMFGEYNRRAFQRYLLRLKTVGYRSKEDWIDRQADYVKMLWRAYNPRGSVKESMDAWQNARQSVKQEMDGFETDYERAKEKADERQKMAADANRQVLLDRLADPDSRARLQSLFDEAMAPPVIQPFPVEASLPTEEPEEAAPAEETAAEAAMTKSQRKNAARRKKEKIAKAMAQLPPQPKQPTEEQVRINEFRAAKEQKRELRKKEQAREKTRAREAEKDRMREKWEEARSGAGKNVSMEEMVFDEPEPEDIVPDLSDSE